MNLDRTLKNIVKSKTKFFNITKGSYVNFDLLKEGGQYMFKDEYFYFWNHFRYNKDKYEILDFTDFLSFDRKIVGEYVYFFKNQIKEKRIKEMITCIMI